MTLHKRKLYVGNRWQMAAKIEQKSTLNPYDRLKLPDTCRLTHETSSFRIPCDS